MFNLCLGHLSHMENNKLLLLEDLMGGGGLYRADVLRLQQEARRLCP